MTKVYLEKDGALHTVTAKGHATGSPEVCAAVSCLIYTIAGYIRQKPNSVRRVEIDEKTAAATVSFTGNTTLFEFAAIGFLQLAKSYEDFISVEITEIK